MSANTDNSATNESTARSCSILVSLDSFISITMLPMIDPIMQLQTHPSLETRPLVQTHTILDFPLTSLEETTSLTPIKIAPTVDDRGRKETISARNLPDVEPVYRACAARFNSFTGAAFDDFRDSRHPLPHQARPPRSFTK